MSKQKDYKGKSNLSFSEGESSNHAGVEKEKYIDKTSKFSKYNFHFSIELILDWEDPYVIERFILTHVYRQFGWT